MNISCVICGGEAPDGPNQVVLKAEKPNKGHDLIAEAMCYDCLFALRNAVVNGSLKFFLGTGEGSEAPEAPPPKWDRSINIENDVDNVNVDARLDELPFVQVIIEAHDRNEGMVYTRTLSVGDARDLGDFLAANVLGSKHEKWEPRGIGVGVVDSWKLIVLAGQNCCGLVFEDKPNIMPKVVKLYETQAHQFWNWLKALPGI